MMSEMFSVGKTGVRLLSSKLKKDEWEKIAFSGMSLAKNGKVTNDTHRLHDLRKIDFQKPTYFKNAHQKIDNRFLFTTDINQNYFRTLGVTKTSKKEEIKIADFKLTRNHYLETSREDDNARQKFNEVGEAYSVLRDNTLKQEYNYYFSQDERDLEQYQQQSNKMDYGFLCTTAINQDYYKTLGVSKTATKGEIRMAYFQLAKRYYLNTIPGDANARKKFKEVGEAYSVLSDDNLRQEYDYYCSQNEKDLEQYRQQFNTKQRIK